MDLYFYFYATTTTRLMGFMPQIYKTYGFYATNLFAWGLVVLECNAQQFSFSMQE
jgi:hypothetical protein